MNDLHLKYKFTDRGGNKVYEKYAAEDRITLLEPMGEIRLGDQASIEAGFDEAMFRVGMKAGGYEKVGDEFKPVENIGEPCWRNHSDIVCRCSKCIDRDDAKYQRQALEETGHGTG
jgi:hypothetical protein